MVPQEALLASVRMEKRGMSSKISSGIPRVGGQPDGVEAEIECLGIAPRFLIWLEENGLDLSHGHPLALAQ